MSVFNIKMRNELLTKGRNAEPIFVKFPGGDSVIYALTNSEYSPYCKYCWNSLVIKKFPETYNHFGDKIKGFCDKCNCQYPIRYV